MASEKFAELVKLGPFKGVDYTTADPFENPESADSAPNVDSTRNLEAMQTARGRSLIPYTNLTHATYGYNALALYYQTYTSGPTGYLGQRYLLASRDLGYTGYGGVDALGIDSQTVQGDVTVTNAAPFSQAVNAFGTTWTNAGQQIGTPRPTTTFPISTALKWQYALGDFISQTYYYAYTVLFTPGVTPSGRYGYTPTTQETSPAGGLATQTLVPPFSVIITGTNGNPVITVGSGATLNVWSGSLADGTAWYVNIYRQSTAQTFWTLVASAVEQVPLALDGDFPYYFYPGADVQQLNNGTAFTDDYTDAQIAGNVELDLYHDPPPFLTYTQANPGGNIYPGYGTTTVGGNYGVTFTHQNCMWAWCVMYENIQSAYYPNTNIQSQLWYSDFGVAWSFNAAEHVLLVGNETFNALPGLGGGYNGYVGNQPMGALSTGAQALLFTRKSFYILDGVDSSTWFIYKRGDKTCISQGSITLCGTEACWLSDEGPMAYQGGQANLIGEAIRLFIDGYTYEDRAASVGWYQNRTWYLAFPTQNVTWAYYFPSKVWLQLPYAPTSVVTATAEVDSYLYPNHPYGYTAAFGLRLTSASQAVVDLMNAAETDLGNAITATWNSPLVDSGKPGWRKTYHFISVEAPIQTGVTCTVTIVIYDLNGVSVTKTLTFNLALGPVTNLVIPDQPKGFACTVTVTLTNAVGATTPATIYAVTVVGTPGEAWSMRT